MYYSNVNNYKRKVVYNKTNRKLNSLLNGAFYTHSSPISLLRQMFRAHEKKLEGMLQVEGTTFMRGNWCRFSVARCPSCCQTVLKTST